MPSVKKSVFGIIKRPLITEKVASVSSYNNCVVLEIHPQANKLEVKNAVEKIFEVKVKNVRTLNSQGKVRKGAKSIGRQVDRKKAYVYLEPGYTIDFIEGL